MFALNARKDKFRLLLPKEFICEEIEEKYTNILKSKNSYFITPIDFINETIQSIQVLGFDNAVFQQQQSSRGSQPILNPNRVDENNFMFPQSEYNYRSEVSPIALMDRTLNINFRHTLGYLNYFLLFENFWYQYCRDRNYKDLNYNFNVDIFDEIGNIYSRIVLSDPLINSIDMLELNFSQPIAENSTFQLSFKYSNFDFQFLEINDDIKSEINVEEI